MMSLDSGIFLRVSNDSTSLVFAMIKLIAASLGASTKSHAENFMRFTYRASASISRLVKPAAL